MPLVGARGKRFLPSDFGDGQDERPMGAWPLWVTLEVLLFAGLSFFCALAETSLFMLSKWRIRQLAERDANRGERVRRLLEEPQDLLAALVLWNTVAYAGLVMVAVWLMVDRSLPAGWTVLATVLLILLGGEVLPKTLALRAPEFWAPRTVVLLEALMALSRPVRRLARNLNTRILRRVAPAAVAAPAEVSDEEYAELLDLAYQEGMLGESERDLILQIVTLDRRMARDVMRPRAQMEGIEDDTPVAQMVVEARRLRHSRIPLYDETPDTIVGILNTRRLLMDPQADFTEVVELPSFVPDTINLLQLLKALQRQGRGMAVVLDEYGSTAGLVTVEDILGPLLGPKAVARQRGAMMVRQVGERAWRVGGAVRFEDFRRYCPELNEVPEVDTLGGMLSTLVGFIPPVGRSVVHGQVQLTAVAVDERRVKALEVRVLGRKEVARRT